jgi:hypothetical protein
LGQDSLALVTFVEILQIWSERQAVLLRRIAVGERVNDQVDWANVAEEIEALGAN